MKNFTKQIILSAFLLIVLVNVGWGQILTFEFSALAGDESTASSNFNNSGLNTSTISRGSGLTASANAQRFNSTNWATGSIANALSGNKYVEFTISPTSGNQFSITTIVVQWQRSGTGNTAISLRSSNDSYATDIDAIKSVTDNTSTQTFTWTVNQSNTTSAVTYRLYSYAEATSGTGGPGDGTGNDIIINGSVTPVGGYSTPTTQASNITFSSVSSIGMSLNWTNGDGSKRLVIMNTSNSFTNPTDGQADPSANTVYSGSGEQVIYNNTSNSVSVTGLSPNITYWYRVYEYNGTGATSKYLTTTGTNNPNSQTTPYAVPSTQANTITFSDVQEKQFTISWVKGDGSSRAVFVKELSGAITNPTNGTTYLASTDWNSKGTQLGTSGYYCVFNNTTGNSVTVTNLASGTLYMVQIFEYNGSGSTSVYNVTTATGNPNSQTTANTVPTISVNPSSLTGFSTNAGTVSTAQTYTLSGSALDPPDDNITVTAPSNYEISTDGTNYSGSTTVAYNGGLLSNTTIYVRIASTSSVGNVIGNVTNEGGNVSSPVNVSVTGFVYSSQPNTQASNIIFSNININSMTVSWTNGDGTNRIVVAKASGTPGVPTDGTSYTANSEFGLGGTIGTSEYVLYNGTGNSVDVAGLTGSTSYTFKVFEYNGSSGTENYLTTSNATSQSTLGLAFYSNGSGDPAVLTNWKSNRDGSGTSPSNFTSGETFVIESGDNMTTTTTWSISGLNSKLQIENGGTLTANNAVTLATTTTFRIDDGGTYIHNYSTAASSTIFNGTESFGANSNIKINNWAGNTIAIITGVTLPYGNLEINWTGNTANWQQGISGTITLCAGNFTFTSAGTGTFRFSAGTAPIVNILGNYTQTGGTVNMASSTGASLAVLKIKGNLIISGGTLTSTSTGSKVVFNGTSEQQYTNSGTNTVPNFELDNNTGLTLNSDLTVSGALTLTNGKITLGSSNLLLSTTAVSGASSTNYIVTNGTGYVKRTISGGNLSFPVGTSTGYAPVYLQEASATNDYSVRVEPDVTGSSPESRIKLRWIITNITANTPNVTMTLGWMAVHEGTVFANNRSTYAKFFDIATGLEMGTGAYTQQFSSEPYTNMRSGITTFSPIGVGPDIGTLPVSLSTLNSVVAGRSIKLNWTTVSETNNSGFDIERKAVDGNYSKIAFVNGHGTVNTPTNYSFEDKNLQTGKYKYRLKQIDHNGNYEYFELNGEVEIGVPKKYDLSQNYPNPFNPVTKINFDLPVDSKVSMLIYDITGREVARLLNGDFRKAGYYTTDFNASSLSSGVYFYSLSTDAYRMTKKMVVIK